MFDCDLIATLFFKGKQKEPDGFYNRNQALFHMKLYELRQEAVNVLVLISVALGILEVAAEAFAVIKRVLLLVGDLTAILVRADAPMENIIIGIMLFKGVCRLFDRNAIGGACAEGKNNRCKCRKK